MPKEQPDLYPPIHAAIEITAPPMLCAEHGEIKTLGCEACWARVVVPGGEYGGEYAKP